MERLEWNGWNGTVGMERIEKVEESVLTLIKIEKVEESCTFGELCSISFTINNKYTDNVEWDNRFCLYFSQQRHIVLTKTTSENSRLIFIAVSYIFHKRNVDLRIEMDGMVIEKRNILNLIKCIGLCNKENKCHFVSHKSSLCVLYSFYAEYYFQYSAETILYEKLNHRNIGLTNYWPIENSQAMDVVGAKDLYEPINCLFSNDRFGTNASALSFNSGFMNAPNGYYLGGNEFTVLAWVKLKSYSKWQRLFDFSNGHTVNNILVTLSDSENKVRFMIANNDVEFDVKSLVLPLDTWYHLGFTLNQGLMSIFIDGNLKNSTQTESTNLGTDDYKGNCYIGKSASNDDPTGNFECDDIKFFNKALTDAEIDSFVKFSKLCYMITIFYGNSVNLKDSEFRHTYLLKTTLN
ncbi:secreted containing Dystroglycan-type cadherin-like domain [Brachionus plicatilis]|uniref:Secreted containing Dystroglycan-type cadherin-like domain n=1 Tax=Brachionus plicatilis TaxID=10195 RepID=A0A3M7T4M0_BRAPC|nr:secreted containing Dystroglycan-type cadherin-like domain [Brachionus plicatilis]